LLEAEAAASGVRDQHFDFWLDIHHRAPRTTSETNYWFVMNERARAIFNSLVHIHKDANDCAASQKSKSLLLGAKASVHSDPKLIIQNDAVKCSHGASISSVNPEQVNYLQSRGISRPEAERMIVRGFTEHVFTRVPSEAFQARAAAMLDGKEGALLQ
jgi:Fe-S cluster assembly protein SufD